MRLMVMKVTTFLFHFPSNTFFIDSLNRSRLRQDGLLTFKLLLRDADDFLRILRGVGVRIGRPPVSRLQDVINR